MNISLIKLALRQIWTNRYLSLVQLLGLSVGLSTCFLIFSYCHYQLTYDNYHEEPDLVFRINASWLSSNNKKTMAAVPGVVGIFLQENKAYVKAGAFIQMFRNDPEILVNEKKFETQDFYYAGGNIENIFNFEWVAGNLKEKGLKEYVILDEKNAKRLFGTVECVGNLIEIHDKNYQVKAVYASWPSNIDLPIKGLIILNKQVAWDQFGYFGFVRVNNKTSESELRTDLFALGEKVNDETSIEDQQIIFEPQNLDGIHFDKSIMVDTPKGNIAYVYIFLISGFILLAIVFVNVLNLTFLKAADQSKNNGLMMILGSSRSHLYWKYSIEVVLLFALAFIISITVIQLLDNTGFLLPEISESFQLNRFLGLTTLSFLISIVSLGIFALKMVLKSSPVHALRKNLGYNLPAARFRKYLVTFQFIITITLFSFFLIIGLQYRYIQNKELGFSPKNVLVIEPGGNKIEKLHQYLSDHYDAESLSLALDMSIPGNDLAFSNVVAPDDKGFEEITVHNITVDTNFLDVLDIPVIQGRPVPSKLITEETLESHKSNILINRTLASKLKNPISQNLLSDGWHKSIVTGVVEDYHFQELHNDIEPLVIEVLKEKTFDMYDHIFFRSDKTAAELYKEFIDNDFNPDIAVKGLNETIMESYNQEKRAYNLLLIFTCISILVSIMGMIGMLAYNMEKRKFEIGIRKVLGANINNLFKLFAREMGLTIMISLLFSLPFIVIFQQKYFSLYSYHVDISLFMMLIPGAIIAALTLLIVLVIVAVRTKQNPALLINRE